MGWDGTERRAPELGLKLGRRADDKSDSQVSWLENHFAGVIRNEFGMLRDELAKAFKAILDQSLGNLPDRVTKLESEKNAVAWRSVLLSVLSAVTVTVCLIVVGKMKGWWL